MKVSSIISEKMEVSEGPIRNMMPAFTKTQKLRKAAGKAAAGATKDEVRQMEVELLTYMEYSGQKKATPEVLKNYFKQKGVGSIGAAVVDAVVAKKRPPVDPLDAAGDAAAGLGGNPPANPNAGGNPPAGNPPAPPTGAPPAPPANPNAGGNPPPAPPTPPAGAPTLQRGTVATDAAGQEYEWMGKLWRNKTTGKYANKAKAAELTQSASTQTNSMYEDAAPALPLSKGDVRAIIKQVVQKAYGGKAGFSQSRFAEPGQGPDVMGMIDTLKSMGYKITR